MRSRTSPLARKLLTVLCVVTVLSLALVGGAAAQTANPPSANRGSPATDCAVITSMPGFPTVKAASLVEPEINLGNEGVVIRQSYIKDGKIYIPPSGLYYTVRLSSWRWSLVNFPALLLGKTVYLADVRHNYVRKSNFEIKKGALVPYGLGLSALELTGTETSWGPKTKNWGATFQVLKPSGNYYGSTWNVRTGTKFAVSTEESLKAVPDDPIFYQNDTLASTGTAVLIPKEVRSDGVTVAEWIVNEVVSVDVAPTAVSKSLAVGEKMDLGKYKVQVTALDATAQTVKVTIFDGDKNVAEKTLGPVTEKLLSLFPSVDADLEILELKYDNIEVGLPAYVEPFKTADKVTLVGYSDVMKMKVTEAFPLDPKWIVYFDT